MGRAFITTISILGALAFTVAGPAPAAAQSYADDPAYAQHERLSPRALDALLAPIALYPDQLLSQILMAATYPHDVEEASGWVAGASNAALRGDALTFALEPWEWDASVKTLAQFPDVLRMMNDEYDWTVRVGNAFLLQEREVMDAVQRLRHQAFSAGHLRSNEFQRVYFDGGAVVIDMIDPASVYIPRYDPIRAYGVWAYPDYEPYYFRRPVIVTRYVVVPALWGWSSWDWRGHRIRVDLPRYRSFNRHRAWHGRDDTWRHDGRRLRDGNVRDVNVRRDGDRERSWDRNRDRNESWRGDNHRNEWRPNEWRRNDRADDRRQERRGERSNENGRADRDGPREFRGEFRGGSRREFQNATPSQPGPPPDGARWGRSERRQQRVDSSPPPSQANPAGGADVQNRDRRGFRGEGDQERRRFGGSFEGQRQLRERPDGNRESGNRRDRQAYAGPQLTPPAPVAPLPQQPRAVGAFRGDGGEGRQRREFNRGDGGEQRARNRQGGGEARANGNGGGRHRGEGERRGRNRGDRPD